MWIMLEVVLVNLQSIEEKKILQIFTSVAIKDLKEYKV